MSFDLARTPTLEAVATKDQQTLAQDLQKRAEESIAAAEARPEAIDARTAQQRTEDRLNRLRKAERALSAYAKDSREQMAAMESRRSKRWSNPRRQKQNRFQKTGRARDDREPESRRVAGHRAPDRRTDSPRADLESAGGSARDDGGGAGGRRIAQVRAEKVLNVLRSAVTDEMVLPVDMSKGVAGALVAHAGRLKKRAVEISDNADHMERTYRNG